MADNRDVNPFNPASAMTMRDHLAGLAMQALLTKGVEARDAAKAAVDAADFLIQVLRAKRVPDTSPGSGPAV